MDNNNNNNNNNKKMPEIPEELVHKITLMSYKLSPHPTAQVIDGTIKPKQLTYKQFNKYLNNITNKAYFRYMEYSCQYDYPADMQTLCWEIKHVLIEDDMFNGLKYNDVKKMMKYNNRHWCARCNDWLGTPDGDPVMRYALFYCFNKLEDSDVYTFNEDEDSDY